MQKNAIAYQSVEPIFFCKAVLIYQAMSSRSFRIAAVTKRNYGDLELTNEHYHGVSSTELVRQHNYLYILPVRHDSIIDPSSFPYH